MGDIGLLNVKRLKLELKKSLELNLYVDFQFSRVHLQSGSQG